MSVVYKQPRLWYFVTAAEQTKGVLNMCLLNICILVEIVKCEFFGPPLVHACLNFNIVLLGPRDLSCILHSEDMSMNK